MRKTMTASIMGLALVVGTTVSVEKQNFTPIAKAAGGTLGYAEYVSEENAPIIDGQIDDVWTVGLSQISSSVGKQGTHGSIDILWNETGLYYLAVVNDSTMNVTDICNLWISERYLGGDSTYSGKPYAEVDGAYNVTVNGEGNDPFSIGDNASDRNFTAKGVIKDNGYILEVYVPLSGETALVHGNSMGFDVSFDDYFKVGTTHSDRGDYVNWCGKGNYWYEPSVLGEVLLVDFIEANGSPVETDNGGDTGENNNENNNENSGENNENNGDNNENENNLSDTPSDTTGGGETKNGCAASVTGLPIAAIIGLAGAAFVKGKKRF